VRARGPALTACPGPLALAQALDDHLVRPAASRRSPPLSPIERCGGAGAAGRLVCPPDDIDRPAAPRERARPLLRGQELRSGPPPGQAGSAVIPGQRPRWLGKRAAAVTLSPVFSVHSGLGGGEFQPAVRRVGAAFLSG